MKSILFPIMALILFFPVKDFKSEQQKNPRVRQAYQEKQQVFSGTLKSHGINENTLEIFIRIFKQDKVLELWGRNKKEKFVLLKTFEICATSGGPGPKRVIGDSQTPEGFYFINRFNPYSNFYLSLGLNFPNTSDKILSKAKDLGGDIFIHGNCVTIGCIPITDDKIKELYIYAIEAKNNGQENIPVHIFPARLDKEGFKKLSAQYKSDQTLISFWENLQTGFNYFEKNKEIPKISILKDGRYDFQ